MKTRAITSIMSTILVVTVGCVGVPGAKEPTALVDTVACEKPTAEPSPISRNELQRQTLGFVFYKDNPMPPPPTKAEMDAIEETVAQAQAHERKMLRDLYENNKDHWIYATRDSDGDGILDYRIGDEGTEGKFMEGDTDIDGDGIPNTLDRHPYDKTKGNDDANRNGVPDHIDWSLAKDKSKQMAEIQEQLYKRHNIILVERSAEFTEPVSQAVYDVITKVFKQLFSQKTELPSLRTVATVQWPALDKSDGTFAQMIAQNATLTIFQLGIDLNPFLRLGVLGHELGHSVQFSLDYSTTDREEHKWNIYRAPNFNRLSELFGWSFEVKSIKTDEIYRIISPQYQELLPYAARFEGKTSEEWDEEFDSLGDDPLNNPWIRERHVVGAYSVSTPYEWHGDHLQAYLSIRMEDHAKQLCGENELKQLKERAKTDSIECLEFYHGNARGNTVAMRYFRGEFPIDDVDLADLTHDYLLGSYPNGCTKPEA